MLVEKDHGVDPVYGQTDWLDGKIASCKHIGVADSDQPQAIIFFQPIAHHFVYGPRKRESDRAFTKIMDKDR